MPVKLQKEPPGLIMWDWLTVWSACFIPTDRYLLALSLNINSESFDGLLWTRASPLARYSSSIQEPVSEVR